MSNLVMRFHLALFEQGSIRTIIWFVATGALLYLAAVFWFGRQDTIAPDLSPKN